MVSHPQKTMSRYTWECKTKEEPDCEVRLIAPQLRPQDSSCPSLCCHPVNQTLMTNPGPPWHPHHQGNQSYVM